MQDDRLTPLQTGPIPDDWKPTRYRDFCSTMNNGFVGESLPHQVPDGSGVLYIQSFNVRANRIDLRKCCSVSSDFAGKQLKALLKAGDIVTVQSGHIGTAAVVPSSIDGASCHALIISRPIQTLVDPQYIAYYQNSYIGHRRMAGLHVGSTIKHINTSELANFVVPLPPLSEQKAIAEILSTSDLAIERSSALISAKRTQRKALAQQLLTGKTRLPGFGDVRPRKKYRFFDLPSDWLCPHLSDIANEKSVRNRVGKDVVVLSCSKHRGFVESAEYFGKQVFSADTSNYKVIRRNWFGYPANHVEEGSIGLLTTHDEGVVSPIYVVFETAESVEPAYLFAVFKTEMYRHIFQAATNASVDRRGSLRWDAFAQLRVPCPSRDEQRAIVNVLHAADAEISLLEQKRTALQQQKKGLMQKLLTGQIRVKP